MFKFRRLRTYQFFEQRLKRLLRSKRRLFLDWFDSSPAENYITVDLTDRENADKYVLTIQRVRGRTPSQALMVLEDDIVRYRSALQEIADLSWDVKDPNQARVRLEEICGIAGDAIDN